MQVIEGESARSEKRMRVGGFCCRRQWRTHLFSRRIFIVHIGVAYQRHLHTEHSEFHLSPSRFKVKL